jgi:hypothetical protein
MSKSFVPAIRGTRKFKIFPDDLAKIYKITKRKAPAHPFLLWKTGKILIN